MANPTVYLETTVIGHLVGRMHSDPVIAGRQTITREWWLTAKDRFRLVISQLVADECAAGDVEAAQERLAMLQDLEFVPDSDDAYHISTATVNNVEYL